MKKYIVLILLIFGGTVSEAQTFAELFKQKKTQKKYLLQQIVALQVYTKYLQKGYSIVSEGLNIIGDIKNGELNLHRDFFHSLERINPKISNYARVTNIMLLQRAIVKQCNNTLKWLSDDDNFNQDELKYIHQVFERLLNDGLATIDALMMLITPGKLEMNDAERLERIDRLYKNMQEQYTFFKQFNTEIKWIAASRQKEENDLQTGYLLYDHRKDKP